MTPAAGATPETVLAFDYGSRRIGVAVGNRRTGTASGIAVVPNRGAEPDWASIGRLLVDWRPGLLVVGLPLDLDGHEPPIAAAARGFARALAGRAGLPVELHDERLTSVEASRRFADARRAGQRRARDAARLDAVAAEVLLESWLASQPPPPERDDGTA
jgi:putative Holliday junction resolvase